MLSDRFVEHLIDGFPNDLAIVIEGHKCGEDNSLMNVNVAQERTEILLLKKSFSFPFEELQGEEVKLAHIVEQEAVVVPVLLKLNWVCLLTQPHQVVYPLFNLEPMIIQDFLDDPVVLLDPGFLQAVKYAIELVDFEIT